MLCLSRGYRGCEVPGLQLTVLVLQVDVWALGVSAIEMAEVTPPRWAVHPMRVIFMIPREPSPQLTDKQHWSPAFHGFLAAALRKARLLLPIDAPGNLLHFSRRNELP